MKHFHDVMRNANTQRWVDNVQNNLFYLRSSASGLLYHWKSKLFFKEVSLNTHGTLLWSQDDQQKTNNQQTNNQMFWLRNDGDWIAVEA